MHWMILIAVLMIHSGLKAQDWDHYQPLTSSGNIPSELLVKSSAKFEEEKSRLEEEELSRRDRANKEKFLLQNNFVMDEMLLSGKILFNDPLNEYVTRLKDYLLRDFPEVRDSIRIYIVKSPAVNAFATNNGIVLVNIGLLAQIENEAQLAFILCHEFQHFINEHPINRYVRTEQLKDNNRYLSRTGEELVFQAKHQYSRELELEADELGADLFLTSMYSAASIDQVFDVLKYAAYPYDNVPWSMDYFQTDDLIFPASYHLDSLDPIEIDEDFDDSYSTHPNIATRRSMMEDQLRGLSNKDKQDFIFGEEGFREIQKLSRYELCHMYVDSRSYEYAIYTAYLLQKDNPNSFYLKKTVAQSLYGLAKHRNERNFFTVHIDFEDMEGEMQQLTYFLEQFDKPALNVLALDYVWRLHQANEDDLELELMAHDLMDELFYHHRETTKQISMEAWQPSEEDAEGVEGPSEDEFHLYGLVNLFKEDAFAEAWGERASQKLIQDVADYEDPYTLSKQRKKEQRKGKKLGIDKVVFLTPIYKKVDERKEVPVEYVAGEESMEYFTQTLEEMADRVDMEYEMLSTKTLESGDIEAFNDIVTIKNWIAEESANSDGMDMVNIYQEEVNALIEKYGTPYFSINGVIALTSKKTFSEAMWLTYTALFIVPIPWIIYKLITPKHGVLYLNYVYDLEKGETLMQEVRYIKSDDRKDMIRSAVYNSVIQMKSEGK